MMSPDGKPYCDMDVNCPYEPTMIGDGGYIYCAYHGPIRRSAGWERVRKMRPHELRRIERGEQVKSY